MGIVYKAEDTRLNRTVVLKFLTGEPDSDLQAPARLHREARMASARSHPNICTIYDVELNESGGFIAMELLTGEALCERASRPLPTGLFWKLRFKWPRWGLKEARSKRMSRCTRTGSEAYGAGRASK